MSEAWLPVPGFEGRYEVSDHGRVRSLTRYHGIIILKTRNTVVDDLQVRLFRKTGEAWRVGASRLVLLAFVGDGGNLEPCYRNGERTDCRLENLYWGTRSNCPTVNSDSWRPIPGYEDLYQISDTGSVRSFDRPSSSVLGGISYGRELGGNVDKDGYRLVSLSDHEGRKRKHRVHRLVLLAFVGPQPVGKPIVRHLNGDPLDNRLENLAYGTHVENMADAKLHGRDRSSQTHCKTGHEFTTENTYLRPEGGRACRECARQGNRRRRLAAAERIAS